MTREARRQFRVSSLNLEAINFTLGLLADRLDELEGRRGTPQFKSDVNMGLNKVTQMQSGSSSTDGATVVQVDGVATDISAVSGATAGVANLSASATPGANRIVMSPSGSQYINNGWIQRYESPAQTITAAGALTLAHGLGVKPVIVTAVLVCQSAEANYSQNDEVFIALGASSSTAASGYGVSVVPDATNLNIRFGSQATTFRINDKTTGAGSNITNSKWKIVFRAWAIGG